MIHRRFQCNNSYVLANPNIQLQSEDAHMNEQKLRELGKNLIKLLEKHGVEIEECRLKVFISKEFYDSIKANFANNSNDAGNIHMQESLWSITLIYMPPMIPFDRTEMPDSQ